MRLAPAVIALLAVLGATSAHAKAKVFISLDVQEDRSPDWVCVVTKTFVCKGTKSPGDTDSGCTTTTVDDFLARIADPDEGSVNGDGSVGAATYLRRQYDPDKLDRCDDVSRRACKPEISFGDFDDGHIVCGGKNRRDPSRVLVLGLTYNTPRTPGVESVELNGGNAVTLTLQSELSTAAVTFVHVLGGDFAPSITPFVGDHESVVVKPNPRCNRFLAVMPAHEDPITEVWLSSLSTGLQRCEANAPFTAALPIELPYTLPNERKTLAVSYRSEHGTGNYEASWTAPYPPPTVELRARVVRFEWEPPGCLADVWPESKTEPVDPQNHDSWNAHCPRVILGNDTPCTVKYSQKSDEPSAGVCRYTCTVDSKRDPLALPLDVHFDRVRMARPQDPSLPPSRESIYRWNDKLSFSGQRLRSSVAAEDRKIMLEFEHAGDWTDLQGDKLDAIRITNRGVSDELALKDRNGAEPPAWTALSTPHRECTDQLNVAVFGTRVYVERARTITHGRLVLPEPYSYRPAVRPYLLVGVGLSYEDVPYLARPTLDLGAGLSIDLKKFYEWDWLLNRRRLGFLSFNVDAKAQLTKIIYRGIETPSDREGFGDRRQQLANVTQVRLDFRAELEWAIERRVGVGIAYGLGFATPLDYDDNAKVGRARFSQTIETNASLVLVPRSLWLIPHVGLRIGEQHFDYTTDFLGDPAPFLRDVVQLFWGLRLRMRIG